MNRYNCLTLFLIMIFTFGSLCAGNKSQSINPKNAKKKVQIVISKKNRIYYQLYKNKQTELTVRGPGVLRVITRARFKPAEEDEVDYYLNYSVDGGKEIEVEIEEVIRSKKATYKDGTYGVPGQLKDFMIELARGYHTVKLNLLESKPQVDAKFIFTPNKLKKQKWISLAPISPVEPVDLVTKEEITNYYRFSDKKPLKVEIFGPTELRILTRVENHFNMKGRINYRIQVKSKEEIVNTFHLSSKRSDVTFYKNDQKLVPGKAREIVINIPEGRNSFEIYPIDAGTYLGRLLFPEKDAALTE